MELDRKEEAEPHCMFVWLTERDCYLLNADFQLGCVVGGDGFQVALLAVNINIFQRGRCLGLVYTCHYNPNITNIIIFWQIHLEMSRGRRIFINDNSHIAHGQASLWWRAWLLPASGQDRHLPVSEWWEETLWDWCGSDRSLNKKRSWAGKYFIQSQTACNLILVPVMLHSL